ncbi:WG repeat-containing protein [Flavobacterium sp. I3-2]|uniref:WG repeat-containing protein n=1 Tax=Flavobacterium sp. I3-2 TaxID=2748319 RepID=UPI0015B37581|nr:WG repeat-containing protein [Flavobacterium sp. I3-2]
MINSEGKEVVPPFYSKIGTFGKYQKDIALVKILDFQFGFIDVNGKEVVPVKYYHLEEAIEALTNTYKK